MNSPVVQTLLTTVGSNWLDGTYQIDLSTISLLVSQLIPAIEKLVTGKGRGVTKKEILIEVVHIILTETNHKDLIDIVDPVLPLVVDSMVELTHNSKGCCTIL